MRARSPCTSAGAVLDAAYAASGLALDFYKSCLAACMFVSGPAFNSLSMRL